MTQTLPKVLLIEDDEILREVNSTKLELDGFDFKTATNGREALELLERYTPDIILLDMMMPIMDGPEFMRRYRRLDGDTTIIIFSNISSPESTRQVMALGAREYLNKSSFTPAELTDHLKAVWHELKHR